MHIVHPLMAAAVLALPAASAAHAASSEWHHVEGASIRIVTSDVADEDGLLRGALEIRLQPGWKTYWLDPGSSGVPPTLEATVNGQQTAVSVAFPEPRRFEDEYAPWAGYDHTVALALTFNLPASRYTSLEANAFLGVCETICIPVQARLQLDPAPALHSQQDEMVVEAAFSALPSAAAEDLHARSIETGADTMTIEAIVPENVEVLDIFVAGTQTLTLGTPVRSEEENRTLFVIPTRGQAGANDELVYTLVTSAGAVTGAFKLP